MPVERVLKQHGHILAGLDALETLVSGPPPRHVEQLGFQRWQFTRDLMMHFAKMEGQVYGPLMDLGGEVARRAGHASAETAALVGAFREHVARWHGLPREQHWDTYRRAILWLTCRVRARIEGEAEEIVPLLGLVPLVDGDACPRRPDDRYVADAWEIRGFIFDGSALVTRNESAPG
jgi:hypothetical protein